ncbi:MAG: PKD domain-containing protein [Candidatus Gracilibacteria bacterium]|nr:PKD domain-containing protein [Candidatus Gracilibacteria bacterium]
MFDPSKLDLDLNNLNKENESAESKSDTIINELNTKNKSTPNTNDILDSLNISEKLNISDNLNVIENFYKKDVNEFVEKNQSLGLNDVMEVLDLPKENTNTVSINQSEIKSEEQIGKTEYEKNIINSQIKTDEKKDNNSVEKIIFDINISSLEILLEILVEKQYDFVTFEPSENYVTLNFRKNKVITETKYIKYPIYSNILIKAKTLAKLTIEETENQQDGKYEIHVKDKFYDIIIRVVPSTNGSKLFIKTKEAVKKSSSKEVKKISVGKIFFYLGIIAFIALIVGGAFMTFVVMNANTVDDVKFFSNLGINLNDINSFILKSVTVIFSIIVLIEVLFLIIYLAKFLLTKKEFKQKKIKFGILGVLILFLAFGSGSGWMILDKKIRSLPNWQEMAYGEIQIYDNSKLISKFFDNNKGLSLIGDTSDLIGPMQIKFDVSYLAKNEERKGLSIKKYIWDFGDKNIIETTIPTIIYDFNDRKNYEVKLTLSEVDKSGKIIEKTVENIPNINITYLVKINERKLNNGGKLVDFDASSVKELGKLEWYFLEDLEKPVWTGEVFRIGKPIFDETLVGMYIKRNDKTSESLDKIFIISGESETNLGGEIKYEKSIINDLEYEFRVENLENDFGNGIIEEYKWTIGDKVITKIGDPIDQIESSKIKFEFKEYGEQTIKVLIKDSSGKSKELSIKIDVPKKLILSSGLRVLNEGKNVENLIYEKKLNEYFIDEILIPTELTLDARFIKANNLLYTLKNVSFDYNSDGDIDEVTKLGKYTASIEGNHTITVNYEFENRKDKTDIINMKEKVFIEGIKKDAILNFEINSNSTYVPVIVGFDASKSQVKNENIEKFIWDYGDGFTEERDAIVIGHKYTTPGEYTIKLKVITTSGKSYTISKQLVLKPKPQTVKITTSMSKAPVGQGIDFLSEKSEGQIIGYFWDFGDGNTSTEANPTHSYKNPGKYKVILRVDFVNKNILEDNTSIEVFE